MYRLLFLVLSFILLNFTAFAQEPVLNSECKEDYQKSIKDYKGYGISAFGDLSYMGYSSGITFEYERKYHGVYAGPQILLSDTYLPVDGPLGINAGYKFYFLNTMKRWRAYVNLDYKNFIYKAYDRNRNSGSKRNFIHEVTIGYGVQFQFWGPLCIGNTVAVGRYFENYYSYRSNERYTFRGYNGLIRFFLKYQFS